MNGPEKLLEHDEKKIWRCPSLGGPVPFKYCRTVQQGLPCARIVECWSPILEVLEFLSENYEKEQIEAIFQSSTKPPKIVQLLGLIEKAQEGKSDS